MPSYVGLYYPFIHFRDESWLKLAALYWDKMGRIVPEGYQTHDSETVRWLADGERFIVGFSPGYYDTHEVAEKFSILLKRHEENLRERYGVDKRDNWSPDPITLASAPEGSDPRLAYVYSDKMWPDLEHALVNTALAVQGRGNLDPQGNLDDRWIGMHPKLASVYMSALAEEMASVHGVYPLSESAIDHLAVTGCTLERLAQALLGDVHILDASPTDDEVAGHMATVALRAVVPRNLTSVPVEKIIEVREQHTAELGAFQDYLHKSVKKMEQRVRETRDPDSLIMHLQHEYQDNLKPQMDDLRERLHSSGIDTVTGAMNVQMAVPPLIATGAPLLGLPPLVPIVAGAAVVAFRIFSVFRDKRTELRNEMRASPAAYLMRVEEGLQPDSLTSSITRTLRRRFFGV